MVILNHKSSHLILLLVHFKDIAEERKYQTSFFHFYHEFQPYGIAELGLHNSTGRGLKHREAEMKAKLHTCVIFPD